MKKSLLLTVTLALVFAQAAAAQAPRTVARQLSHTLTLDGAGKLTITYRSLHFNEGAYNNALKSPQVLTNLNRLWKKIGTLNSEFDVEIGGVKVPKGAYDLGINFDQNNNFKLLLGAEGNEISIPLQFATDAAVVNYLAFDLVPNSETDGFALVGRYGKLRASAAVKVPFLSPQQ